MKKESPTRLKSFFWKGIYYLALSLFAGQLYDAGLLWLAFIIVVVFWDDLWI